MLNPDYVMQTLGAIVQAYASLLAITGAFYIFIIEKVKTEFERLSDELDTQIQIMNNTLERFGIMNLIINRNAIKMHGEDHLDSTLEILARENDEKVINSLKNSIDWINLKNKLAEYEDKKKRIESWAFKQFEWFFVYLLLILLFSITWMALISNHGLPVLIKIGFHLIVIFGFVGIGYFTAILVKIAKI